MKLSLALKLVVSEITSEHYTCCKLASKPTALHSTDKHCTVESVVLQIKVNVLWSAEGSKAQPEDSDVCRWQ